MNSNKVNEDSVNRKCRELLERVALREIKGQLKLVSIGEVKFTLFNLDRDLGVYFIAQGNFSPVDQNVYKSYDIFGEICLHEVNFDRVAVAQ